MFWNSELNEHFLDSHLKNVHILNISNPICTNIYPMDNSCEVSLQLDKKNKKLKFHGYYGNDDHFESFKL
jgi:hypothetical protein